MCLLFHNGLHASCTVNRPGKYGNFTQTTLSQCRHASLALREGPRQLRTVVYLVVERDAQPRRESWPPALPIEPCPYMEGHSGKQRQASTVSSMWLAICIPEHRFDPTGSSRFILASRVLSVTLPCCHVGVTRLVRKN
jgi:hypothetical protein